jgi:hypothetical protein
MAGVVPDSTTVTTEAMLRQQSPLRQLRRLQLCDLVTAI